MAYRDLRVFLARLEEAGELVRIGVEVDPVHEVAAVCRKVLNDGGPAVRFDRVKGQRMPLVSNIVATRVRFAMALETSPEDLAPELAKRMAKKIDPVVVKDALCKEKVISGKDVNLYDLPIPVWSERDGGPFLTLPCDISKDPETGIRNAAIYRSQIFDRNTIGIHGSAYRHLFRHRAKAGQDKRFPLAIAMGCDPTIHIASATPMPVDYDELALAGALRGEPVELVPCETIPLEVPANSEIVLEGYIKPNSETRREGPFGDWLGYYDEQSQCPVMEVTTITHRRQPIMLASFEGRPPHDSAVINSVMFEQELMRAVSLPGLKKIHVHDAGGLTAVAALENKSEGYARQMALALLGTWAGRHIKVLILIDADLDPGNATDVNWALSTRFQPDRDIQVLHNLVGSRLDPSTHHHSTSKIIIDATKIETEDQPTECWPHKDVWQRVLADWARYGLSNGIRRSRG
jgi:4-hydroxy-3-polyprenylbenzoate decarboxylase